ncbi:hypothetical protein BDA99DRAFT_494665 [Phascolomyces articulosus]|uniref:Uncharacterized protein n=1 Tax=Phascolomyces articulosus TaxID=60185 RepID=A0AAD5KPQ1_9FUNG|nr:hypothetical protein BDA99DRAFT_494665 [Phascolomyces articulosus]
MLDSKYAWSFFFIKTPVFFCLYFLYVDIIFTYVYIYILFVCFCIYKRIRRKQISYLYV